MSAMTRRLQYVGLGAVVLVTVALVVAALTRDFAPAALMPSPAAAAVTPTEAPVQPPATLDQIKALIATGAPLVVSVLGDSTGNDSGEWVDLWAKGLGSSRQVTLHQWDSKTEDWNPEPISYGSNGPELAIWNGSQPGARATYPLDKFDRIQPVKPDVVIYSFGHNGTEDTIVGELGQTMARGTTQWAVQIPSVVILQNPGQNEHAPIQDATLVALTTWAGQAGEPLIDVASAFRAAPDFEYLMKDDAHPNWHGAEVWAGVVSAALT